MYIYKTSLDEFFYAVYVTLRTVYSATEWATYVFFKIPIGVST